MRSGIKSRVLRIGLLVFALVSLNVVLTLRALQQSSNPGPFALELNVEDRTNSFDVIEKSVRGRHLRLVVRNVSNSVIFEFAYSTSPLAGYIWDQLSILPGETHLLEIANPRRGEDGTITVSFLAVMFSDGDTVGDPGIVENMRNRALGMALMKPRISKIFENFSPESEAGLVESLEELRKEIRSLEAPEEPKESSITLNTMSTEKSRALLKVDELEEIYRAKDFVRFHEMLARMKSGYRLQSENSLRQAGRIR